MATYPQFVGETVFYVVCMGWKGQDPKLYTTGPPAPAENLGILNEVTTEQSIITYYSQERQIFINKLFTICHLTQVANIARGCISYVTLKVLKVLMCRMIYSL